MLCDDDRRVNALWQWWRARVLRARIQRSWQLYLYEYQWNARHNLFGSNRRMTRSMRLTLAMYASEARAKGLESAMVYADALARALPPVDEEKKRWR